MLADEDQNDVITSHRHREFSNVFFSGAYDFIVVMQLECKLVPMSVAHLSLAMRTTQTVVKAALAWFEENMRRTAA